MLPGVLRVGSRLGNNNPIQVDKLGGWIRGLGKGVFGMWAFKAHHGLSKPIVGFCFQKNGPHIFGSPKLVGTLPQVPFFSQKNGLIFLEALSLWVRCRRRLFFFRKMAPIFLEALNFWARCRRRFFSHKNGPQIFDMSSG